MIRAPLTCTQSSSKPLAKMDSGSNVACTVQSAVTGAVLQIMPARVPPHPLTDFSWCPTSAASVKLMVVSAGTSCGVSGVMLPEPVTCGVTR